jgi:hypothetical protein
LPDKIDQTKFGVMIITLKNAKHIDLCDRGPSQIKKESIKEIQNFLNKNI